MINQLAISRTSFKVDGGRVRKTGKTKGTVDDAAESWNFFKRLPTIYLSKFFFFQNFINYNFYFYIIFLHFSLNKTKFYSIDFFLQLHFVALVVLYYCSYKWIESSIGSYLINSSKKSRSRFERDNFVFLRHEVRCFSCIYLFFATTWTILQVVLFHHFSNSSSISVPFLSFIPPQLFPICRGISQPILSREAANTVLLA